MPRVLLFVYGTLMRGQSAHALLGPGARFVAEARTEPKFMLADMGEYPALVEGGRTAVSGELYEVDDAVLVVLDDYEDVPHMYERRSVEIGGQTAFVYLLRPELADGVPIIASGDWRAP
jgi:gamma-glutamylaminecyclotransferase